MFGIKLTRVGVITLFALAVLSGCGSESSAKVHRISLVKRLYIELYLGKSGDLKIDQNTFLNSRAMAATREDIRQDFQQSITSGSFLFEDHRDPLGGAVMTWRLREYVIQCDSHGGVSAK